MRQIGQRGEKIYSGQEILDRRMDGKMDGQTIWCQQSLIVSYKMTLFLMFYSVPTNRLFNLILDMFF